MTDQAVVGAKSDALGCFGCLIWLFVFFVVAFVLTHWSQLQDRLARLLGL